MSSDAKKDNAADVVVEKRVQRRLDAAIVARHLSRLADRALAGSRRRQGWTLEGRLPAPPPKRDGDGWLYRAKLRFVRRRRAAAAIVARQTADIRRIVGAAGAARGWVVVGADTPSREKPYATFPSAGPAVFRRLFGLDNQVDVVLRTIDLAMSTGFGKRMHVLLWGPPGCGKTELLRCVVDAFGRDVVLEFDATNTTQAGAVRVLQEAAAVPRILVVEEIEKASEESLRWLLAVLDTRGEIRKVVHRSSIEKDVRLLCLATANNIRQFEQVMHGALVDRFQRVYCPQPTREVLRTILEREVASIGGRRQWIEPAIRYCLDQERTQDARRVIWTCLVGRDGLLDGSFQKSLQATKEPSAHRERRYGAARRRGGA